VCAPGAAADSGGGTTYVAPPKVAAVKCLTGCEKKGKAVRGGGELKVAGTQLSGVTKVIFTGGRGTRDDVAVDVIPASDRAIKIAVPMSAQSGPLMVWAGDAAKAKSKAFKIMPPLPPIASAQLSASAGPADPGAPTLETGTSLTKYFLGSRGGIRFEYRVASTGPVSAQVTLTRATDGAVVQTWPAPSVAPGAIQTVTWNGIVDKMPAPEGRYLFALSVTDGAGRSAKSAGVSNPQRDAFDLYQHIFPVRGAHNYGEAAARFGAGRSGHIHQGQDVMANCGLKLVAARGGVVKFSGFQSAAGNYVVIDGANDDTDYAYMHLAQPSPLEEGDKVYTGQQVGVVGDTGDATACHLHFEEWSAPGWYDGGSPFDPLPDLQAWDAVS
jgi:murein DD-endopeptidase MepM/ murein hydrolase activator NlpD